MSGLRTFEAVEIKLAVNEKDEGKPKMKGRKLKARKLGK